MFFLIPISHSELTFSRLPFATIGLILVNMVVFFFTWGAMDEGLELEKEARARVVHYYVEHDYLEVPEEMLAQFPKVDKFLYAQKGEWIEWFLANPEKATREIEGILDISGRQFLATEADRADQKLRTLEGAGGSARKDSLEKIRSSFLVRIADLDFDEWTKQQTRLDEMDSKYREIASGTVARRFGFVPSQPGLLGLLGHMFLHGGIVHLIMNMLILWLVASKLEDLWGRTVLLISFVVLGIVAAAAHGLVNWGSPIPTVGASGAIAGLMGAFLVRLSRTKIKFAYFIWIWIKPRFGTFEAPAAAMLPLWLLTEVIYSLILGDYSSVAYWAHIGGFAAGVMLAFGFKLTDFERRVLKIEPYQQQDSGELPLVAFQSAGPTAPPLVTSATEAQPRPVASPPLVVREWSVTGLDQSGVTCTGPGDEMMILDSSSVTAVYAGRVDSLGGQLATEWFSSGRAPSPPAILVALLHGAGGTSRACLIDAGTLRYNRFMSPHEIKQSPRENFFEFLRLLRDTFPGSFPANLEMSLETTNLPVHADLEDFLSSIRRNTNRQE